MRKVIASGAIIVYMISVVTFCLLLPKEGEKATATDFGVMCINAVYPSASIELADSRDNEDVPGEEGGGTDQDTSGGDDAQNEEKSDPVVLGDEPLVLIVHTHATESYLPQSGSNFHSTGEENTVRDVGNTLAASLEAEGISVVHDKTLHDNPSYNNSYNRSYDTIQQLLEEYPSIVCVIDLHRDAIAAETAAATVSVNGKTCAKYSYVVGNLASTYKDNLAFINNLNKTASESYNGYTGKVLERGYRYNQEARNSAEIFGKILADTLKKGQ